MRFRQDSAESDVRSAAGLEATSFDEANPSKALIDLSDDVVRDVNGVLGRERA
jgi:hypothetical protein